MNGRKHYTIISGTGRAGTTLLVRVLTVAGLDTGYTPAGLRVDPRAHAGLELDLRDKPDCAIVKSPWIATYAAEVLSRDDIAIDHAIICMRRLDHAAESRRRIQALSGSDATVHGGLVMTSDPAEQETVLARSFFDLLFELSRAEVPMTFLHFPRYAHDADYFVDKMSGVFPEVDPARLIDAYRAEVRPELITDFAAGPGP